MQSAASKRVLSTLASKLHPQLPLSPRESQQLLTLLTTSFRAHLDREHPVTDNKPPQQSTGSSAPSSYASASQHIDSILTNPLFAVKPRRRPSEFAAADVLRDPLGWFLDEIAAGSATLSKAVICIQSLHLAAVTPARHRDGKTPASIIAEWLRTSGTDTSKEFIQISLKGQEHKYLDTGFPKIVAMLFAQGEGAALWRWYIRSPEQRIKETNLDLETITKFRETLLWNMVFAQTRVSLANGIAIFMQAFRMAEVTGQPTAYDSLRHSGMHLVNKIMATPNHSLQPELYQAFMLTCRRWSGRWSMAVEPMLWLHHPTERSAAQGLRYIQDPNGALFHLQGARKSRRNFLVQLCLGVARQLLEENKLAEAQVAMEFAKIHFADLVLPKTVPAKAKAGPVAKPSIVVGKREKKNLKLLDQLIPT